MAAKMCEVCGAAPIDGRAAVLPGAVWNRLLAADRPRLPADDPIGKRWQSIAVCAACRDRIGPLLKTLAGLGSKMLAVVPRDAVIAECRAWVERWPTLTASTIPSTPDEQALIFSSLADAKKRVKSAILDEAQQ